MPESTKRSIDRRQVLIGGAATVGVGAVAGGGYAVYRSRPVEDAKFSMEEHDSTGFYRRLGRTDLMVSSIGIGAGDLGRPGILARAVDSGLNFVDTSICYGSSEEDIRRELEARPDLRDELIIATKWDAGQRSPKKVILESLDRSLSRLGVDVIDIMQLHWLGGGHVSGDDGFNRLDNPELYEAMEDAKSSGKVRFFGATSHDSNRSAILQHAIDKGVFDMLLVKMNVLDFEDAGMPALLEKARKNDVGVVAMKSQAEGGRMPPGFEGERWNAFQANLRWVLSKDIACVVHSDIGNDEAAQDQAIEAAKSELTARDAELLERYARALSPEYCRGCGDRCESACPAGLSIAAVLHAVMYHRSYDRPERAREAYHHLPAARRWSDACSTCDACSDACPYGVDAAGRMRYAHEHLG